jgi:hypothetical protein
MSWLGLLYSTMCLAAQFKSPCPDGCVCTGMPQKCSQDLLLRYREKTVQCLILAQYGRGGPFIMETLLHYFTVENYLRRDSNTGLWLLLGSIVQIGMSSMFILMSQYLCSVSDTNGISPGSTPLQVTLSLRWGNATTGMDTHLHIRCRAGYTVGPPHDYQRFHL